MMRNCKYVLPAVIILLAGRSPCSPPVFTLRYLCSGKPVISFTSLSPLLPYKRRSWATFTPSCNGEFSVISGQPTSVAFQLQSPKKEGQLAVWCMVVPPGKQHWPECCEVMVL